MPADRTVDHMRTDLGDRCVDARSERPLDPSA
jgi:hypothetical protein